MLKSGIVLLLLWSLACIEAETSTNSIMMIIATVWTLLFLVLNRKVLTSLI